MYEFLGITLVLALLLTINATATMIAAGFGRLCRPLLRKCSARTRAEILFRDAHRPAGPRNRGDRRLHDPVVSDLRAACERRIGELETGPARDALGDWSRSRDLARHPSWLATRSLLKDWLANSTQIELETVSVPTFVLQHSFPIIAVVGAIRPRLFIADHVLESLSAEELAAAVSHECGHLAAHDNFKRSVMRVSRAALLLIPCGRSLDRAWSEASESAADEHAAQQSSLVALNLASALVRIARMIPNGQRQEIPAAVSAFLSR